MNLHIRYVYWIAARLPSCEIWEFSSPALGKVRLFRTFCICFYDIALWTYYTVGAFNRFASCYYKCMKCFFGYPKCSSVTNMLFELGLPSFNTLIYNSNISFANSASACDNTIVQCVLLLNSWLCCVVSLSISVCVVYVSMDLVVWAKINEWMNEQRCVKPGWTETVPVRIACVDY